MQNLGGGGGGSGGIRCIMGNVRVANGANHVLRTRYGSVIFCDPCYAHFYHESCLIDLFG